jgi:hypothetical protein
VEAKIRERNDNAIMETITASGRFRPVDIRDINRCILYLQVFYTSDIADNRSKTLEPWVMKGKRQITRKIIWEWPVQQRPTAWKSWKQAITEMLAQDSSMFQTLGAWYVEHHTKQEWYLDTRAQELWHQSNDKWTRNQAQNIGRLRFATHGAEGAEPPRHALAHVATVTQRHRYIEISKQTPLRTQHKTQIMQLVPYVSAIGEAFHALPKHVQRLVGDIGEFQTPRQLDVTKEVDLIIATDGSVLFGVGYHIWILATETEDILLAGGGPDDGPGKYMTSYRSELGGIIAGLAVLGTLTLSGLINARPQPLLLRKET